MSESRNKLIINSPYVEPSQHLKYDRETQRFNLVPSRRLAGYVVASPSSKAIDDPGEFREIELANRIRRHIQRWRQDGRPGLSGVSSSLWRHWNREERHSKLFYCQLEAIETLLFLIEAPADYKVGLDDIPGDGSPFLRWCNKMATGSGKTIVMAMLIAVNILNKTTNRQDVRFSKNILVVAPGLTVKSRLSVLQPADPQNYYDAFDIVPPDLKERLNEGKVKVINWHVLMPQKEKQRSVVKLGAESDEAFTRRVLGDMGSARNILVINDEAHHAWRLKPGESQEDYLKHDITGGDTTQWMGGLDRIHKTRVVIRCHDLSATPFRPMGRNVKEEQLFDWVVSDFGLNDAIESGLVKTPRIVIRDDSKTIDRKTLKSKLYHIYNDESVRANLSKKSTGEPLPELVKTAYLLLSEDWRLTQDEWSKVEQSPPPVMISICNLVETAARIEKGLSLNHLTVAQGFDETARTLRIDSKVLGEAEKKPESDSDAFSGKKTSGYRQRLREIIEANTSLDERERQRLGDLKNEDLLREIVDSVGKPRAAGAQVHHVIAVAMLSEGWDTKNVTHIMGLRAFTSQLLCEQVVGRGLRRVNYTVNPDTEHFDPEYVNVFGVPFSYLPSEDVSDAPPSPTPPQTRIEVDPSRAHYGISWPNVIRIEYVHRPQFLTTLGDLEPIEIDCSSVPTSAELAAVIEGKTSEALALAEISLGEIASRYRLQTVIFKITAGIVEKLVSRSQSKSRMDLAPKVMQLTEEFINSDKLSFKPKLGNNLVRRKVALIMNMSAIVSRVAESILRDEKSIEKTELVFDSHNPIRSTANMPAWHTTKPTEPIKRSHISHVVVDSSWEMIVAQALDNINDDAGQHVKYWVKNDHLGFAIGYIYEGVLREYIPDFIIRLNNDKTLVLEVKGQDSERDKVKRRALDEWVKAVNSDGRFGVWAWSVVFEPGDLVDAILGHI